MMSNKTENLKNPELGNYGDHTCPFIGEVLDQEDIDKIINDYTETPTIFKKEVQAILIMCDGCPGIPECPQNKSFQEFVA